MNINFTIALIFMFGVAASLDQPVVASDHTGSSKKFITHPVEIDTEVGKTRD